ncbi:hypothetical protein FZEAL_9695 [Fusarium zealandicum]|uniref:Uncharacterized protein n=1 Tax=Fusarium zealandicum TaxID=1053134 RepID=A0A8H4XEC5_9HYPO|nr:hypothetical protein FZEAL_9695 [Fusarium zealandicum]
MRRCHNPARTEPSRSRIDKFKLTAALEATLRDTTAVRPDIVSKIRVIENEAEAGLPSELQSLAKEDVEAFSGPISGLFLDRDSGPRMKASTTWSRERFKRTNPRNKRSTRDLNLSAAIEDKARPSRRRTSLDEPVPSRNTHLDAKYIAHDASQLYDIELRGPTGDWQHAKVTYDPESAYSFISPATTKRLDINLQTISAKPSSSSIFKDLRPKHWAHNVGLRSVGMGVKGISVNLVVSAERVGPCEIIIGKEAMEQLEKASQTTHAKRNDSENVTSEGGLTTYSTTSSESVSFSPDNSITLQFGGSWIENESLFCTSPPNYSLATAGDPRDLDCGSPFDYSVISDNVFNLPADDYICQQMGFGTRQACVAPAQTMDLSLSGELLEPLREQTDDCLGRGELCLGRGELELGHVEDINLYV